MTKQEYLSSILSTVTMLGVELNNRSLQRIKNDFETINERVFILNGKEYTGILVGIVHENIGGVLVTSNNETILIEESVESIQNIYHTDDSDYTCSLMRIRKEDSIYNKYHMLLNK